MKYPPWVRLLPDVPNTEVVKEKVTAYPHWCKQNNPAFSPETAKVVMDGAGFVRIPFPKFTLWGFPEDYLRDHFIQTVGGSSL